MDVWRLLNLGVKRLVPPGMRPVLRRASSRLIHYGRECYCPVCRAHLRAFVAHVSCDGSVRPFAECPVCGACERHRQFWKFMEDFRVLDGRPKTVLHIAPEWGLRQRFSRSPGVTYIAGGLVPAPGDRALDLTNLNLPSESVDFLYAGHVLNMIADERAAICEAFRVLRGHGMAILQVPLFRDESIDYRGDDASESLRLFIDPHMHHIFGRDLLARFRDAGFDLAVVPYGDLMSESFRHRYGFEKQDIIVCIKRATPEEGEACPRT